MRIGDKVAYAVLCNKKAYIRVGYVVDVAPNGSCYVKNEDGFPSGWRNRDKMVRIPNERSLRK